MTLTGLAASSTLRTIAILGAAALLAGCTQTAGGIHYALNRVRPNVYAGGYWIKMEADLSVRPKRLTFRNDDNSCQWAAMAP